MYDINKMNLINNIKNYFKFNSEFGKNVLTIFTGATIAQIIPFIVSPILTRIYSPENFGLLSLFISITSVFSIVVTFQYESAIVLPKSDKDAAALVYLCFIITLIVSFISFIFSILFNKNFISWFGAEMLKFWIYLIPIPVFLTGIYNALNNWATRKKQYKRITVRTISQSITTNLLKIVFGINKFLRGGLISASIIGQATATFVLALLTWKDDKNIFKKIGVNDIKRNLVNYKNFPKYTAWQGFFDMINASGTTFIITSFFGSATLGLYSFTLSILQRPLQLIGASIAQVYYQKASELYNEGKDIWGITKKLIERLTVISIFIFIPIAIAGPAIFSFIFGQKWQQAGVIAQILLPWLIIRFIGSPFTSSINIIGKQKSFFFLTLFINILFPFLLFICFTLNINFIISLFFVSIVTAIYFILIIFWIKKLLYERDKSFK